jgi:sugar-specific transcriptional regulator TrmB
MLTALCGVLLIGPSSVADDAVKDKLDKVRTTYDTKLKAAREEVAKKLDDRAAAAAKSGNKKIVDRVEAEREAFDKESLFPTVVEVGPLKKQVEDARLALVAAYKVAVTEYTKAGMRAEAKTAEEESAELQKAAAEVRLKEVFAKGTVLTGRKKNDPNATTPKGTDEPFQLTVSERTGTTFKGEILVNGKRTYAVGGEITGGEVSFTSEKKDNDSFHQTYKGTLKGTQIAFTFEGTGTASATVNVKGNATLSPKR